MPGPMESFTLTPHPAAHGRAVQRIHGRLCRIPGGLRLHYVLEGEIERVRVPERRPARFADDLWRHTCFELFVAGHGAPGYHEFNFSPSGEWAVYAFVREREREPLSAAAVDIDPRVSVRRSATMLELDAIAHLDRLLPTDADHRLAISLSAVVEEHDGTLSYWALEHPLDRPDFHHPASFALVLDEIRN